MSYDASPRPVPGTDGDADAGTGGYLGNARSVGRFRVVALLGMLVVTWSYVGVLWSVTQVVGGTAPLVPVVVVSGLLAAVAARYLRPRWAVGLAGVALVGGYVYYLLAVPGGVALLFDRTAKLVSDAVALLTGLRVVQVTRVDLWALGFVPGPVFLSWYLALRERYLAGALVGGATLFVLVLTNDAGALVTLAGVLGGVAAVGFGELDRRDGTLPQAETLVMLVALVAVLAPLVSVVPGSPVDPLRLDLGGPDTVEGTFVGSPGEMQVVGAIELSAEQRYRVTADEPRYWRTGVYDRFTGGSWVRTGQATRYEEADLPEPPGPRKELVQTYEVVSDDELRTMPAVNQPVEVIGEASSIAAVAPQRTLQPRTTLIEGDAYRVRSQVPDATPDQLRRAGTDYPEDLLEQYTQLPSSTSGEFRAVTANVTEGADAPYDVAVQVETYLERTKEYDTDIRRPNGNIANNFLLEMDAGYCTYFATTMVAMLRSEGVPARVATGYTPGESVGENEYLVRGLDSHVWVEVYFPDQGWVRFDPTPAEPRQDREAAALREGTGGDGGGGGGDGGGDGGDGGDGRRTLAPPTTTVNDTTDDDGPLTLDPGNSGRTVTTDQSGTTSDGADPSSGGGPGDRNGGGGGGIPLPTPSREQAAIGVIGMLGLAAGAHRAGVGEGVARAVRLRYQPDADPTTDVERAVGRLELLLAERYRPRETGETRRAYRDDLEDRGLDERAARVFAIHERARHAGTVDRETADEAVDLVDDLVGEQTTLLGRFRRA